MTIIKQNHFCRCKTDLIEDGGFLTKEDIETENLILLKSTITGKEGIQL
jgi:hypothetical protein